jgi:hypothetical protein
VIPGRKRIAIETARHHFTTLLPRGHFATPTPDLNCRETAGWGLGFALRGEFFATGPGFDVTGLRF